MSSRLPFDATHLIVATSASTERTQFVDELAALQKMYPKLTLELWGSEQINQHLRCYADVVAQFWTRETADTLCTSAPPSGVPAPPPDCRLKAESATTPRYRYIRAIPTMPYHLGSTRGCG
jgi:hypothetical protein